MSNFLEIQEIDDPDQPSIHLDLVPFGNPLEGDSNEGQIYSDKSEEIRNGSQKHRPVYAIGDTTNTKEIDSQMPFKQSNETRDQQTTSPQTNKDENKEKIDIIKQDIEKNSMNSNNKNLNIDQDQSQQLDNSQDKFQHNQSINHHREEINSKNQSLNPKDIEPKILSQRLNQERKYNNQVQSNEKQSEGEEKQKVQIVQKKSMQKKVKKCMTTKIIQYFLIFLIFIYTLLIFATLAIDDLLSDDELKEEILDKFQILELAILFIFTLEICLTSYSQGVKIYFRDKWLLFDTIIIVVSIALVILNLVLDFGKTYQSVSGSIRGIFRFLRIFLLLRKVQTFKQIKNSSKVSTHQEKIIEILQEIREQFEESTILADIEWAMEIIKQNKIYEQSLDGKDQQEQNWLTMYKVNNVDDNQKHQIKRKQTLKVGAAYQFPLNTLPTPCIKMFDSGIQDSKFNCFEFQKLAKGEELLYIMVYLFDHYNLFQSLSITPQIFIKFFKQIQSLYIDTNQFHTSLHAFDVTQTIHYFIEKCKFVEIAQLDELEIASMHMAAACHDVGHPGVNNAFLINTLDNLTILYNDRSVLEQYHLTQTFELLQQEEYDFLEGLEPSQYKRIREVMISTILSTDMTKHFSDISKAKARLSASDFDITGKDKMMCMELILHASDISNPIKQWDVCFEWSHRIMEEFWQQGDKERDIGLPITYLCDRYTTNIAKSQTGFIDFVVRPLMEIIINIIPIAQPIIDSMDQNSKTWVTKEDEYKKRLEILNEARQEQLFKIKEG